MKKMTFIALVFDKNRQGEHQHKDFQRWTYKRAQTVQKRMLELCERYNFSEYYGKVCKIYATPNGYDLEPQPTLVFDFPKSK